MVQATLQESGVLFLRGEITSEKIDPLLDAILACNLEGGRDYLHLYLNSPGGDVDQGFALIDLMRWSSIPIRCTAMGHVGSMALLILMAGKQGQRAVMPHCSILSHRIFSMNQDKHTDVMATRVQEDLIHRRVVNHYLEYTKLDDSHSIETAFVQSTERWLTPSECLRFGMVDSILGIDPLAHSKEIDIHKADRPDP